MEVQDEGFLCYPLLFRLPVRLSREDLTGLSLGAALWGRRHGLLTFEDLVSWCCSKWREGADSLEPLAGLTKEQYSETPPYLNDHGFSPAWISLIFHARYLLQQANSFTTRLKFRFSREKCLEDAWKEIEKLLTPHVSKGNLCE